jgi:hypothetical protein
MSSEVRVAGSNCNNFYQLVDFFNSNFDCTPATLQAFYTSVHPTTTCTDCPITRCFNRAKSLFPTIIFMNRIKIYNLQTAQQVTDLYARVKQAFPAPSEDLDNFYRTALFTIAAKEFLTFLEQANPTNETQIKDLYLQFRGKLPQDINKYVFERKERDALFLASKAVLEVYRAMYADWEEDYKIARESHATYAPAKICAPPIMQAVRQVREDFNDLLPTPNIIPDDLVNPNTPDEIAHYEIELAKRAAARTIKREGDRRCHRVERGIQNELNSLIGQIADRILSDLLGEIAVNITQIERKQNPIIRKILATYQENLL